MDRWMDGRTDEWTDGWMDGMDGWTDGQTNGWMDGWTEKRVNEYMKLGCCFEHMFGNCVT